MIPSILISNPFHPFHVANSEILDQLYLRHSLHYSTFYLCDEDCSWWRNFSLKKGSVIEWWSFVCTKIQSKLYFIQFSRQIPSIQTFLHPSVQPYHPNLSQKSIFLIFYFPNFFESCFRVGIHRKSVCASIRSWSLD